MSHARTYTKTTPTTDTEAIQLNDALNDCNRVIAIGTECWAVYRDRFKGDAKAFRKWVRANLDRDELSIFRYMRLAEHAGELKRAGIIRLIDAYDYLDLSGKVSFELVVADTRYLI